jgi:hypothetical protein
MNTTHLSPQRLKNLQLLFAFVAGICVPLLGDFLLDALVMVSQPLKPVTWRDYTTTGIKIAGALLMLAMAYRLIRRSKLPGVATIALLVGLLWANLLLSH